MPLISLRETSVSAFEQLVLPLRLALVLACSIGKEDHYATFLHRICCSVLVSMVTLVYINWTNKGIAKDSSLLSHNEKNSFHC